MQDIVNADRAAAGLAPLGWSPCLASIAKDNANRLAAQGYLSHADGVQRDFSCGLASRQTGENIAYWTGGVNDDAVNNLYMNSPEHKANILGPYRYVGTAWTVAPNGWGYEVEEFG